MIRCQPLLGTFVEIQISTEECNQAKELAAITSAFDAIKKVQELMSVHSVFSDLSLINALAHKQAVSVHPWLWQVISISKDLYLLSEGLFNVGIGHVLAEIGARPIFTRHLKPMGDIEDIELLEKNQIRSKNPVHLDLGGIAKGFAVDRAVDALLSCGINEGVVNAGGDMRAFGSKPHPVKVRSPKDQNLLIDMGILMDGAIATSANYFTPSDKDGHATGHIVRSQAKAIEKSSDSFSVVAPLCALADALTKVFMLSGDAQHPCILKYQAQAFQLSV
jgi:thiamine biosynthesis lipoprotein